jgi:hypothetical protein
MGLFSSEIDHILRSNEQTKKLYVGTFPCDLLKVQVVKTYPALYVGNLSPSTDSGSHWISVYLHSDRSADFFDTYARPLKKQHDINEFVVNNVRRDCAVNELTGASLQGNDSDVCGHWCVLFSDLRAQQVDFGRFLSMFEDERAGAFDQAVKRYVLNNYCLSNKCAPSEISCPFPKQKCVCKYKVCCS